MGNMQNMCMLLSHICSTPTNLTITETLKQLPLVLMMSMLMVVVEGVVVVVAVVLLVVVELAVLVVISLWL